MLECDSAATAHIDMGDGNDKMTVKTGGNMGSFRIRGNGGSDLIVVEDGKFFDINGGGSGGGSSDPNSNDRIFVFGGSAEGAELQSGNGTDPFILFFGGELKGIERLGLNSGGNPNTPRGSIEVNAGSSGAIVVFDGGKLTGFSEFELQDGALDVSVYFRSGLIDTGPTKFSNDAGINFYDRESALEGNNQSNKFIFDPVNSKKPDEFLSAATTATSGAHADVSTDKLKDMLGITTGSTPAAESNPNAVMTIITNEIEMNGGDDVVRFVGARNVGDDKNLILRSRNAANEIVDEAPEFDGGSGIDYFEVMQGSRLLLGEVEGFEYLSITGRSMLTLELEDEGSGIEDLEFSKAVTVDGTSVLQIVSEEEGETEVELKTETLTLLSNPTSLPDLGLLEGLLPQYDPFVTGGILQIGALPGAEEEDEDDGDEEGGTIALTVETDTFNNGGTISMLTGVAGDSLTVDGSYISTANNGKLALDTALGDSDSETDKLVLEGSVDGTTTIYINNAGGKGGFTGQGDNDGIVIVAGDDFDPDAFKLAVNALSGRQEVIGGGFAYVLRVNEDEVLLQSDILDQVPAYVSAPSVGQRLVSAGLDTLYKRLGEIRNGQNAGATSSDGLIWVRGSFSDVDVDAKEGYDFSQRSSGVTGGLGGVIAGDSSARLAVGIFGSYGKADAGVDAVIFGQASKSSVDADAWGGGAYATYYELGRPGTGLYVDTVVKADFIDFGMSSSARGVHSSADGDALTASGEVGYGFGVGGLVVQPQAQLAYTSLTIDGFEDSYGVQAHYGTSESLIGRLGVQLQANIVQADGGLISPYAIFNVYSEFEGSNQSKISDVEFVSDVSGTWYSAGGGVTAKLANALSFYGSGEYHFGDVEGWQGTGGLKVNW